LTTENKEKSGCLIAGYYKTPFDGTYIRDKQFTVLDLNAKSRTIRNGGSATATDKHNWDLIVHNTMPRSSTSGKGGTGHLSRNDGKTYCLDTGNTNAVEIVAMRVRGENNEQQLEARKDNKTNSLTSVQKDNLLLLNERQKANFKNGDEKANTFLSTSCKGSQANGMTLVRQLNPSLESGGKQPYQHNRVYDTNGISPTLNTDVRSPGILTHSRIRRLTPIECERLQTVADNYTNHVSDSQRYKMLGNGWTIEVIIHILKYITL
jgi:site-specific DNA-cytosine methylase